LVPRILFHWSGGIPLFRPGLGPCPAGREELARALGKSLCPKSLAPAGDGALEMGPKHGGNGKPHGD